MSRALDSRCVTDRRIEDTLLRPRVRRWLQAAGIVTVGQLTERTEAELLALPNLGPTCLCEIREFLAEHGLSLSPPRTQPCGTDRVIAALKDRRCPLTRREATILELRHGIARPRPLTLAETGDHFDLTRERVRQIQKKAENKIFAHMA